VQRNYGGAVWFNTDCSLGSSRAKYGVIGTQDLVDDLEQWRWLYVAGRLQKPVKFLQSATSEPLQNALRQNLASAFHTSLLLLPERFTDVELFQTITSLSYSGDVRMGLAENPHKVSNIVSGSLPYFHDLYGDLLGGQQADTLFQHSVQSVLSSGTTDKVYVQNMDPEIRLKRLEAIPIKATQGPNEGFLEPSQISNVLAQRVASSSRAQTLKGLFSAGPVTALFYGLRKVGKRFLKP